MRCLTKLGLTCSLSFAFVFSLLLSSCIYQDSSAVSDRSYTVDKNSYSTFYTFCSDSADDPCDDYHYVSIVYNNSTRVPSAYSFTYRLSSNTNLTYWLQSDISSQYFEIDTSLFIYRAGGTLSNYFTNNPDTDLSFTITLSENTPWQCPTCPDCPTCQECEECQDCSEGCTYNDKFDAIIVAIYTVGAVLLVIYFFYCIYRIIIGTTGSYNK